MDRWSVCPQQINHRRLEAPGIVRVAHARYGLERATCDALERDARQSWLERVDREGEDLSVTTNNRHTECGTTFKRDAAK